MPSLLSALLIASLAGKAAGARIRRSADLAQKAGAKATWLKHQQRFCLADDINVECDGETIISLYSAFYSKGWRAKCAPFPGGTTDGAPCLENATKEVEQRCNGKAACTIPPSVHPSTCGTHFSMRVVWNCIAGTPATAEDDKKADIMEDDPDSVDANPEKGDARAMDVVKKVKSHDEHILTFDTCYRHTRWSLLKNLNVFSRLTDCPGHEGCFKLTWPDNRVYSDPEVPPPEEDVVRASLAEGQDGWSKTLFSFGLKRNDYETWGICLPKELGTDFAVALFNTMKEAI